jgi:FixJ family two-component response regulator
MVVDDDDSVRSSLSLLIESEGWRPQAFASAREFLSSPRPPAPCCLLLDVNLPELSGLELQRRIAGDRLEMPIIFITGCGDVPTTVRAMKAGAMEFLTKPLQRGALVDAIHSALDRSVAALEQAVQKRELHDNYASLSPREKEVMDLVVSGRLNKQVGGDLGISEATVKFHRGRMMRKMKARSLPALVNMAAKLRSSA